MNQRIGLLSDYDKRNLHVDGFNHDGKMSALGYEYSFSFGKALGQEDQTYM